MVLISFDSFPSFLLQINVACVVKLLRWNLAYCFCLRKK